MRSGRKDPCYSPTLNTDVAARTCVQARSNGVWYQRNGLAWVSPVDEASQTDPVGDCSDCYPF